MAYLFYAFTAAQLINMYNLKSAYCKNIQSDIYIQTGNRISLEIIRKIYLSNLFERIYVDNKLIHTEDELESLDEDIKKNKAIKQPLTLLPKPIKWIGALCLSIKRNWTLTKVIQQRDKQVNYDRIFVGTCGMSSLYIIKEITKRRKNRVPISFVEEGVLNYQWSVKDVCLENARPKLNSMTYWVNKIFGITEKYCNYLVTSVDGIYLYSPSSYIFNDDVNVYRLPSITPENPTKDLLQSKSYDTVLEQYSERTCCYLMQDPTPMLGKVIQTIVSTINPMKIVFREHPWHPLLKNLSGEGNLEYVYIDSSSNTVPFEALLADLDTDNFILITTDSSATLTPKYMFDKEPYVIYLYHLTQNRTDSDILNRDKLVQNLESLYQNKGRIFVPKSIAELRESISMIKGRE